MVDLIDFDADFIDISVLSKLSIKEQCRMQLVCKKWSTLVENCLLKSKNGELNFISSLNNEKTLDVVFDHLKAQIPFGFEPNIDGFKELVYKFPPDADAKFWALLNKFGQNIFEVNFRLARLLVSGRDPYGGDNEFYSLSRKPVLFPYIFEFLAADSIHIQRLSFSQVYFYKSILNLCSFRHLKSLCLHSAQTSYENLMENCEQLGLLIGSLTHFGASRLPYALIEYLSLTKNVWPIPLNLFFHITSNVLKYDDDAKQTFALLRRCKNSSIYLHFFVSRLEGTNTKFTELVLLSADSLVWLDVHCRTVKLPLNFINALASTPNLVTLKISGTRFMLADGDICAISRWLRNLTTLHLGRTVCNGVEDFLPLSQLTLMKDFLIYGAFAFHNVVLHRLVWYWSKTLEKLHVERCKRVTSYGLYRCLCVSEALRSVIFLVCRFGSAEHFAQMHWCAPLSLRNVRFSSRPDNEMDVDDKVKVMLENSLDAKCSWTKQEFILHKKHVNIGLDLFKSSVQMCNQCPFCQEYVITE